MRLGRARTKQRGRARLRLLGAAVLALGLAAYAPSTAVADGTNPTLNVDYDAVGSTHIGAGVNSDMALGPTVLKSTMDLVTTDIVAGSLPIPSQQLGFSVFGIPSRATVTMTQQGPLTGTVTVTDQRGKLLLKSHATYDIAISNVEAKVFGVWWPLGVGSRCHTGTPVEINASTPDGQYFTVTDGGPLTTKYTIGAFKGCTPLNYLDIPGFVPWFGSVPIDAIVSGSNNTLSLQLSNGRNGG